MTFSIIDIGRTGAGFSRYWLDTTAHNIANINTVRTTEEGPFRARMVQATEIRSDAGDAIGGVGVGDVVELDDSPALRYDPQHPLADEKGMVAMPNVDLAGEMTNLIQAQRSYQLSMKVIQSGQEAYQSALRLGGR